MSEDVLSQLDGALRSIAEGEAVLRALGVLRSQRDIDVDFSEWWVAQRLGGERAASTVERGFDVLLADGQRVQVRKNRKAPGNAFRQTFWVDDCRNTDSAALVMLNSDRTVMECYLVPIEDLRAGSIGTPRKGGWLLRTAELNGYRLPAAPGS